MILELIDNYFLSLILIFLIHLLILLHYLIIS